MIPITESQNSKVYFVGVDTVLTTSADIETALGSAKAVGCLQSAIDTTISRAVNEYKCLSSDESAKSLGSISLPNFSMELLFDADNTEGQKELRDMFTDNTRRQIVIELTDGEAPYATIASGEAYPSTITFEVAVSGLGESITMDSAVMQMATVEVCSIPAKIYFDASNTKA